ncbi:MAG: hypothetical protein ACI9CE_003083 [Flavobacterium sp.]|jgi:hypothetical protein
MGAEVKLTLGYSVPSVFNSLLHKIAYKKIVVTVPLRMHPQAIEERR